MLGEGTFALIFGSSGSRRFSKMKKRMVSVSVFLLLLPLAMAQEFQTNDTWIYQSAYLVLDTHMQVGADITATSDKSYIESITGKVDFYPRETPEQKLLTRDFRPTPEATPQGLLFRWQEPKEKSLEAVMDARLKTQNNPPRVTSKVPFPLDDLPQDIEPFTKKGEIIDIDDDIIALASSLAEGEDDLTVVVDNIAAWTTQNIRYNLTSVTADASKKASWVLKNKEGVCDELTSLFIAMLRSLRIPARFVAGISYTNSPLFQQKWGPHGWAEVYFPGYGWIPYDVTYGEYGFVDPTHIVARYSSDAGKITTEFSWKARDTSVKVTPFKSEVHVARRSSPG